MRSVPWLLVLCLVTSGEDPPNGPEPVDPAFHALVGGDVFVRPGEVRRGWTVLIRDGKIAAVSPNPVPAGARIWDCKGCTIHAAFLDAYAPVQTDATLDAQGLRKLGFGAAVHAPAKGNWRGAARLVSLADKPAEYKKDVYYACGFDRKKRGKDGFPTSEMGAIAVLRQGLYDKKTKLPLAFDTENELQALRSARIATAFERTALLLGSGLEFRRLHAIAATGLPVVLPLRFPPAPDVASVSTRESVDLRELMTWEQAPTTARRLDDAGVTVALTAAKLDRKNFARNLGEAIRHGLKKDRALAMLTTHPAKLLGIDKELGTLDPGKRANIAVRSSPSLFAPDTPFRAVWIDGKRYELQAPKPKLDGEWDLGARGKLVWKKGKVTRDGKAAREHTVRGQHVHMVFQGPLVLSGIVAGDTIEGHGIEADGRRFSWRATRKAIGETAEPKTKPKTSKTKADPVPETFGYPFGPYARAALPKMRHVRFVGATVWTSGPAGIVTDGEVEIRDGKIVYVGPRRKGQLGAATIDVSGRHITPGIVDCHSHTGISGGVNDSGQAVTAEVRIGDVTNPDSISWYRQLAAGVTTVNNLHGSANPIGGQNQVNKIRWGVRDPNGMHFLAAPPGIKFALGENVKQSNWGDEYKTRYPQTRMGVEALIRDRFHAAQAYARRNDVDKVDLELEALAEILAGERLIHCHSYRQDEILMLCRVARDFGFRIGTFQHVLEGYKVADAIKDAAIGGSAFSDWWAYKVEVQDAIPYNGALMRAVGVLVSFNSDSDELARRLNLEAAKAVKYGGVPRAEAFKFVTINPAIQLGVGDRIGSLENGKDADLAIWSGDPLSVYTHCVATWIDGREYWSENTDGEARKTIAAERRRLIAKVLRSPRAKQDRKKQTDGDVPTRIWWMEKFRAARCGVCGGAR